jgi:hypothetical protein
MEVITTLPESTQYYGEPVINMVGMYETDDIYELISLPANELQYIV